MGGGGSTQGEVDFPDYIKQAHHEMLSDGGDFITNKTLSSVFRQLLFRNPYLGGDDDMQAIGVGGDYDTLGNRFPIGANVWEDAYDEKLDSDPKTVQEEWLNNVEELFTPAEGNGFDGLFNLTDPEIGLSESNNNSASAQEITSQAASKARTESDLIPQQEWQDYIDKAVNSIVDGDVAEEVNTQGLAQAARDGATQEVLEIVNNSDTNVQHREVAEGLMEEARQKADEAGVLSEINWSQVRQDALQLAGDETSSAIAKAKDVVNSQPIQDAVDAYKQRTETRRIQNERQFTGSMADINAVNSSAFAFGLSLIIAEEQRDVNRFESELNRQAFQNVLQIHQQTLGQALQAKLQTESTNKQAREQFIQAMTQITGQVYNNKVQLRSLLYRLHEQAYGRELGAEYEAESQYAQSKNQLMSQAAETMAQMLSLKKNFEQSLLSFFESTFRSTLQARLQTATQKKRHVDEKFMTMLQQAPKWEQINFDQGRTAYENLLETLRIKHVDEREQVSAVREMRKRDAEWELKVFESGANILAAPSGMARQLPEGPSAASSALGGALSGAGSGAAVGSAIAPGIGTAIGAGAGAIIGGASGYLSA